jgi:antirestriction protein ArdC
MSAFDLYQTVTDQIVTMLESGVVPWRSPILAQRAGQPTNLISGKPYRGINAFLLAMTAYGKGYGSAHWCTFNQAKSRGGSVRKGEKSAMVVFWKQYDTTDRKTGKPIRVPVLRYFNVFNVEQCEGIATGESSAAAEPRGCEPIQAAEAIAKGYADGPAVEHHGHRAFYRPAVDAVTMPEPAAFTSIEAYHATLFHELSHNAESRIMPHGRRFSLQSPAIGRLVAA